MQWLSHVLTLLANDLRIEWRSKDVLTAMFMFALIVITVFAVLFEPGSRLLKEVIPGLLWAALLFAANLGMNRAFVREMENSGMTGLRMCPVPRSAIYTAKLVSQLIYMLLTAVMILPVLMVFFDMPMPRQPLLFAFILVCGSAGFAAVGTLLTAMTVRTRARDMMLPLLLFPLTVPVILSAVKGTTRAMLAESPQTILPWLRILIGYDIIMITVCVLLFDYVIDD